MILIAHKEPQKFAKISREGDFESAGPPKAGQMAVRIEDFELRGQKIPKTIGNAENEEIFLRGCGKPTREIFVKPDPISLGSHGAINVEKIDIIRENVVDVAGYPLDTVFWDLQPFLKLYTGFHHAARDLDLYGLGVGIEFLQKQTL